MFREFAKHNILLSSYKYNPIDYEGRKSSLFNGRNLVLLDWKLDGDEGEDKALGIISDIINSKKILFCGIYTKERPEIVFNNILQARKLFSLPFGLHLWQCLARLADNLCKVVTVVHIGNVEVILCPFVGWS